MDADGHRLGLLAFQNGVLTRASFFCMRVSVRSICKHACTLVFIPNGQYSHQLVKMVVTATEVDGTTDAFEVMARAHAEVNTPHLTLEMCNAVQKSSGKPFVPSSPQALVFLLKAMKPEIALHASGDCRSMIGDVAVGELMRRFKAGGQVTSRRIASVPSANISWFT